MGSIRFQGARGEGNLYHDAITLQLYFDEHFGKFYRVEQVIVSARVRYFTDIHVQPSGGDVMDIVVIRELYAFVKHIRQISTVVNGVQVGLSDVCFRPMNDSGT